MRTIFIDIPSTVLYSQVVTKLMVIISHMVKDRSNDRLYVQQKCENLVKARNEATIQHTGMLRSLKEEKKACQHTAEPCIFNRRTISCPQALQALKHTSASRVLIMTNTHNEPM